MRASMAETGVVVHADPDVLAQAVAARLIIKLIDAQAERGSAGVVLTGGRVAAAVYRAVRDLPASDAVDWSRVDVWWGDERFVEASSEERNDVQARRALSGLADDGLITLIAPDRYGLPELPTAR